MPLFMVTISWLVAVSIPLCGFPKRRSEAQQKFPWVSGDTSLHCRDELFMALDLKTEEVEELEAARRQRVQKAFPMHCEF